MLAWLWTPRETESLRAALAAGVDVSVASGEALDLVVATAAELGSTARVHLKIDTGLSRNGCTAADWPALLDAAAKAVASGTVEATGIWSHFAYADSPGHPTHRPPAGALRRRARGRPRSRRATRSCGTWPTRRPR